MEHVNIDVTIRETSGKGVARKLRQAQKLPAVLNDRGKSIALAVDKKQMVKLFNTNQSGFAVLNLKVSNSDTERNHLAMVRDYQVHPVTRELLHIDFKEVQATEPVVIHVPVVFKGTPVGVKLGGQLRIVTRWVDLECLPANIVEHVEMDISKVGAGKTVHASDLELPGVLNLKSPSGTVLCQVSTVAAASEGPEEPAGEAAPAASSEASPPAADKK